jgi:hypothetical protein
MEMLVKISLKIVYTNLMRKLQMDTRQYNLWMEIWKLAWLKMVFFKDLEVSYLLMVVFLLGNLNKVSKMDRVLWYLQMVTFFRAIINKGHHYMELWCLLLVWLLKEHTAKGKVLKNLKMIQSMLVSSLMDCLMVMEK